MPKKIYAVDTTMGSLLSFGALAGPLAALGAYQRSLVGGTVVTVNSVADMVAKVIAAAGSDKIYNLIILGHGHEAFQSVGCGTKGDSTGDYSLQTDVMGSALVGSAATSLAKLAPLFTSDAIVVLGGCNVGGETKDPLGFTISGQHLLKAVSKALGGIYVEASDFPQVSFYPTTFGKTTRCNATSCFVSSRVISFDKF